MVHDDGWFASRPSLLSQFPLAYIPISQRPPVRPPQFVQVLRLEKKRTDVDIATHLLMDCFYNRFDEAVIISNDGDVTFPIQIVRDHFSKTVGVVNPHPKSKRRVNFIKASTYNLRSINNSVLSSSQVPTTLTDAKGQFSKPTCW